MTHHMPLPSQVGPGYPVYPPCPHRCVEELKLVVSGDGGLPGFGCPECGHLEEAPDLAEATRARWINDWELQNEWRKFFFMDPLPPPD